MIGDELKTKATLVGLIPETYLIINVPAIPGILPRLKEGNTITVKYIYDGNVFGFHSCTLSYMLKPDIVLFISYPMSVENINLRKVQRLECLLPVSVTFVEMEFNGVILDISTEGCRICFEYSSHESIYIDVGQIIKLSIKIPGITYDLALNGTIRNFKKDRRVVEIGVEFGDADKKAKETVRRYMISLSDLQFPPLIKA
jgi:hypothetical protein